MPGQVAIRSPYTITLGGMVLVAVNDLLWGDPSNLLRLTPEFPGIEEALYLGGGARMFERGGGRSRFHTLDFTRVRVHAAIVDALRFQISHPADLPAGGQDLTITINGLSGTATLAKAAILSAPIHTLHRLSITAYTIKGGALTSNIYESANILDEAGDTFEAEDAQPLEQE